MIADIATCECPSPTQEIGAGSIPIRVVVGSRYPMMQAGIREAVSREFPTASVEYALELNDVLPLLDEATADLLILHLSHTAAAKRANLHALRRAHPATKMLLVAPQDSRDVVLWCLETGVHGVVVSSVTPSQLQEALRVVMDGHIYVPPTLAAPASPTSQPTQPSARRLNSSNLTQRQSQVLQLLSEGRSNKDIARRLGLGVGTVKVHMSHLFATLGAHSRVEAVVRSGVAQQLAMDSVL